MAFKIKPVVLLSIAIEILKLLVSVFENHTENEAL